MPLPYTLPEVKAKIKELEHLVGAYDQLSEEHFPDDLERLAYEFLLLLRHDHLTRIRYKKRVRSVQLKLQLEDAKREK